MRLLDACTVAAALDWEAFAANTSPLHPAVALARPYPGIARRSAQMRELLAGSYLWQPGVARNLQDPLTFRNAAGILGAVDDGLGFACAQLAIELNAAHENPLVAVADELIISVPNYEALPLAAALDFARIALVPAISSAQERSVKLLQAPLTGLGTGLQEAEAESNECALSELAWASQALMVEARSLAHPVSTETASTMLAEGIEDRITMAPLAARRLSEQVAVSEELLALGLVVAAQAVDVRGCAPLGSGTARAQAQIRERYGFVAAGESIGPTAERSSSSCARARSVSRADEQSLRPWLAQLAATGRLVEIGEELDPAAGLAARLVAHRREPVRIARVRDSNLPLVANLLAGRSLIADALGVPEAGLGDRLRRALDSPIDAQIADAGPSQELVEESPDLSRLPIPRFFEHEGGPYITAGCIVARDPETGERNWSIARVRPLGGSRALVGIAPNHHLAVAARAARERGLRLPIAVTVGNHPALLVAACLYLARGEDELRVAGALLGEPVELVRCRHVPLEVPSGCELVLEGELDLDASVEEGPVSEFHGGYERYGRAATATFQCLTRRRDALFQVILPGFHPEHAMLGGVAIAAGLERRLREAVPSVQAVAVPESGAGRLSAVVALGPHEQGEARSAALAALEAVNLVKLVTVVDDDVDPWDDAAVAHAVATRVHFDRDLHVLPGMRADRAEPLEQRGTVAKLAIDATRQAADRSDWTLAEPPL